MRVRGRRALVAAAAASLVLSGAAPALASHFRSSNEALAIDGESLSWTLNSAWAKDDNDAFLGLGTTVSVKSTTSGATPDSGTATSVSAEVTSETSDVTSPLYDVKTEVVTADLTDIGTVDGYTGLLELYAENCCRVDGVLNGGEDFSEWVKWTRNEDGSYNLPPVFNDVQLYDMISGVAQTFDFTATDPEADAVTYSLVTDQASPWYGATELACSTFEDGVLSLGPDLCTGDDVFADIYTEGSFWAAKVMATDAGGNENVANLLLRVPAPPTVFGEHMGSEGGYEVFNLYNEDPDTTQPTSWTLTCTNDSDPSDVVTTSAATEPVMNTDVELVFSQLNTTYTCDPSGTNTIGTSSGNTFSYTTPATLGQTIVFPAVADTAVNQGPVSLSATSSSGLEVTYTSATPEVCTVSGAEVSLLAEGVCEITADQAGDESYSAAASVSRSFTVLAAVVPPAPPAPSGGGSSAPSDPAPVASVPVAPAPPVTPCSSDAVCLAPVNPAAPVAPGSSVALENGVPVPVTVTRNTTNSGLVASGDGWRLALAGTDAGQRPVELTPDGRLVVERGRFATTSGEGFKPNSEVKVYMFSDPILLGTLMTDANGSFIGALPVPTSVPAGNHTLQVNGFAPNSEVRSVSLGVVLKAPATKTMKAVVYFASGSAKLDKAAKVKIKALAAKVQAKGKVASVGVRVVGFVQPTASTSNDLSLSTARARAVAKQLRVDGVKGKYNVSGMGKAAESGAQARRVEVTVTYLPR